MRWRWIAARNFDACYGTEYIPPLQWQNYDASSIIFLWLVYTLKSSFYCSICFIAVFSSIHDMKAVFWIPAESAREPERSTFSDESRLDHVRPIDGVCKSEHKSIQANTFFPTQIHFSLHKGGCVCLLGLIDRWGNNLWIWIRGWIQEFFLMEWTRISSTVTHYDQLNKGHI